jgi:CRISP-associated protein Cas1
MKRSYYIFNSGRLRRKDNTVFFEPQTAEAKPPANPLPEEDILLDTPDDGDSPAFDAKQRRVVPIDDIDSFCVFGEITFNSRFLNFLAQQNIPLHVFNYYGFYSGSYYPREYLQSGFLLVNQVEHYRSPEKRIVLAQKFVEGAAANILKNLRYYNNRETTANKLQHHIEAIERYTADLGASADVPTLMGLEGNIRQQYYGAFPAILKEQYDFERRVKHPPDNAVNALISFANSMVYTACLSEIYRTQLSPLISFLHEPGERRFSLALDLAEIFKPLLADRIIFKMLNQKMITHKDFDKALNYCYLKPEARKTFVKEFEEKMTTTIEHRKLKRKVSYRRLIRLECYKLIKHLTTGEVYEPFVAWW